MNDTSEIKKPELLAPAGDLEKLKIAFMYGADAVYAGVPEFGMRVKEIGFDMDSLAEGIEFAHQLGKKVYVTVNIFAKNADIELLPQFLHKLEKIKPDALIVADPGVMGIIEDEKIKIPIHISTQANIVNWRAVQWWVEKMNFERVILARELHWTEIREIKDRLPKIDLEIFVHGAMCMSYSGRCNISNYLTLRDANQGDCSHCCRWNYKVYVEEQTRPGELMAVEEDDRGSYFFNSKDLCLIGMLDEVIKTGVMSLKIEGRNKSIYYLAQVVGQYRLAIDDYFADKKRYKDNIENYISELNAATSRGYTTAFFGKDGSNMVNLDFQRQEKQKQFVGLVLGEVGERTQIEARNQIKVGDKLDLYTVNGVQEIRIDEFLHEDGSKMGDVVNTNTIFYVKTNQWPKYSMIRKIIG
jgi:putative protease